MTGKARASHTHSIFVTKANEQSATGEAEECLLDSGKQNLASKHGKKINVKD